MKRYGINNDYYDPDIENEHNYMLDTCIFNKLCYNEGLISKLEKSVQLGFRYFYTRIQIREMNGMKDVGEKLEKVSSEELDKKKPEFDNIIRRLDVKKTGHMAILSAKTWILDGSCYLTAEEDGEFVESIRKGNMKHNEDMIIAESVIRKGCILVTNDRALKKKVEKTYLNKVISLDELISIIKSGE